MKTYDGLVRGFGVHRIKITLQNNEYKGSFIYELNGNCKGYSILEFDICEYGTDDINRWEIEEGCSIYRNEDLDFLNVILSDEDGNICAYDLAENDFMHMIVGIEIVGFEKNE